MMYKEDLKLIRGVLGMTQVEFADALGYSSAYIRDMESGKLDICLSVHKKIARLLHGDAFREKLDRLDSLWQELSQYLRE